MVDHMCRPLYCRLASIREPAYIRSNLDNAMSSGEMMLFAQAAAEPIWIMNEGGITLEIKLVEIQSDP